MAFLKDYALLNIYAPSGTDKKYERGVFFSQTIFEACTWLMGGDFNSILTRSDVENGVGFNQKNCPQSSDLLAAMNLSDAFRILHPTSKQYTFFRPQVALSRLDRFYIPHNMSI